jgi:hypothetical protein
MRFIAIGLIAGVCLSGCAPTLIGANQAGGMISNFRTNGLLANSGDAFALANASCQKYGKVARISGNVGGNFNSPGTLTFDCVSR